MLVQLPTVAEIVSSTSQFTGGMFSEILPIALAGLGLFLAGAFVAWLIQNIGSVVYKITNPYVDIMGTRHKNKADRDEVNKYW